MTVTSGEPVGTYDPTVVVGAAGRLGIADFVGVPAATGLPRWYLHVATVSGAEPGRPRIERTLMDAGRYPLR